MKTNRDTPFLFALMKDYLSYSKPKNMLTDIDITHCAQLGLGPILANTYLKYDELTTTKQRQKLKSIKLTAKYYTSAHESALYEILNRTINQNIKVILLKGAHVSRVYYQHPHLRLMGDIDILVDKVHTNDVTNILISLGYAQRSHNPDSFYETHHHLKPFYHNETGVCIEVHTHLFSEPNILSSHTLFKLDYIFQNPTLIKYKDLQIHALAPELNLHYTITHWIREFKIENSFIQLIDVCLLMGQENFNWENFIALIKTRDHATEIKLTLGFLVRNNLVSLQKNIADEIFSKKDSMGVFGAWLLQTILNGYSDQNKFITIIIGSANNSRILNSYLRDKPGILNHFHAFNALMFVSEQYNQSLISNSKNRLKNLLKRCVGGHKEN